MYTEEHTGLIINHKLPMYKKYASQTARMNLQTSVKYIQLPHIARNYCNSNSSCHDKNDNYFEKYSIPINGMGKQIQQQADNKQNKIISQQIVSNISPNITKYGQFMKNISQQIFRTTNFNLQKQILQSDTQQSVQYPSLSQHTPHKAKLKSKMNTTRAENWSEIEGNYLGIMKRYKDKVNQEMIQLDFNLTKKYRLRAMKSIKNQSSRESSNKKILHKLPASKFTLMTKNAQNPTILASKQQQKQNHIPKTFLKLLKNNKSNKKFPSPYSNSQHKTLETQFLSTMNRKRVKQIKQMKILSGKQISDVSTVAGSLPVIL